MVLEDLRVGVDPLERRTPQDDDGWAKLEFILEEPTTFASFDELAGKRAPGDDVQPLIAVQFSLSYFRALPTAHLAAKRAKPNLSMLRVHRTDVAYA